MAKGYWIASVDVADPEAYKGYIAAHTPVLRRFGARFLVRGGQRQVVEGTVRQKSVVIEFESYQVALECYQSDDYQQAAAIRHRFAVSDIVIVEGYEG
jgi:uncharacterized protein (DUF1330 family)